MSVWCQSRLVSVFTRPIWGMSKDIFHSRGLQQNLLLQSVCTSSAHIENIRHIVQVIRLLVQNNSGLQQFERQITIHSYMYSRAVTVFFHLVSMEIMPGHELQDQQKPLRFYRSFHIYYVTENENPELYFENDLNTAGHSGSLAALISGEEVITILTPH